MHIKDWMKDREIPGTLADHVRQMLAKDRTYQAMKQNLWRLSVLEVLIANGGSQGHAARKLGVHRNTIGRALQELGLRVIDVRDAARRAKES